MAAARGGEEQQQQQQQQQRWSDLHEQQRQQQEQEGHEQEEAAEDALSRAGTNEDDISPTSSVRRAHSSPEREHDTDALHTPTSVARPANDHERGRTDSGKRKTDFLRSIFHHHHHSRPSSSSASSSPPRPGRKSGEHALAPAMANAFVSKSRRVRFDLTLRIHDLNNVPLVSGTSFVKWHLPSSTAAEHRGRTPKAAIKEHRVVFGYEKLTAVRLVVGKGGMLQESWIHLEVLQEYSAGGRGERITLGHIRLNLAEYVEASEAASSPLSATAAPAAGGVTTTNTADAAVEEGVTRRYLMQDSKINSTLKVGVYMRHTEGTRDYVAPPLRTAPVFGGIAGIISSSEPAAMGSTAGLNAKLEGDGNGADGDGVMPTPNLNLSSRNKEAGEMQDMYRRTLAAYWASQPGELKADECVEDIFAGGDGWGKGGRPQNHSPAQSGSRPSTPNADGETTPRENSSGATKMGRSLMGVHKRTISRHGAKMRAPRKSAGELDEMEVRDDLVGWQINEKAYA